VNCTRAIDRPRAASSPGLHTREVFVNTDIYNAVESRMKTALSSQDYKSWIEPLRYRIEENRVVVVVPNKFYVDWIEDNYLNILEDILEGFMQCPVELQFQTKDAKPAKPAAASPAYNPKTARSINPFNPRYTFDKFVIGPCNELAHAACWAAAEYPGRQYNPLVIYGGAGMGKTHLLSAAGHRILEKYPNLKVHYSTLEVFTNELIQSVRNEGISKFQEKYRRIDCLLLDDIQFLANRERTQEELFHTFNALFEAGKQIIVTSDKMPRQIPGLEKRLITRFEWGLLADMQPPEEETKVAILQKKSAEKGLEIPKSVAFFLAQQPEANVRVLEGYLNRLIAVSKFKRQDLTVDLVREVLVPLLGERQVTAKEILKEVSSAFNVRISDLKGSRKTREISLPRQVSMYLIRRLTRSSFPEIGRILGGKDHSTVVKGVKKLSETLNRDKDLAQRVRSVEKALLETGKRKEELVKS
jgi:chromosomal replication initiator protein